MANDYNNSFVLVQVLENNLRFTRGDGSTYDISIASLQNSSVIDDVEISGNSLNFKKVSGDVVSLDLSSYNGFDDVTLDATTKNLTFYNNSEEIISVNFETLINNTFKF